MKPKGIDDYYWLEMVSSILFVGGRYSIKSFPALCKRLEENGKAYNRDNAHLAFNSIRRLVPLSS